MKRQLFDFGEARTIRMLRSKEKHTHFIYGSLENTPSGRVLCSGSERGCPICEMVNRKRSLAFRVKVFILDVWEAALKLVDKKGR